VSVVIVAFDGVLAHTLDVRTDAIIEAASDRRLWADPPPAPSHIAARDEGAAAVMDRAHVRELMPGRTLYEVLRLALPTADETALDLLTMRAQQLVSARLVHGIEVSSDVRALVDRATAVGTRVVLRSDSVRRDVEAVLALTGLDVAFTFLRCADDPAANGRGESAIGASYEAIARRLDARGIGVADRVAWESGAFAASIARPHVGDARVHHERA
jgi:beta-phosphoglucomutase-like phosphatase (HAD superfamily)